MPQFIRQILRQIDTNEEETAVRDDDRNDENVSLESTGADVQNRDGESSWQTVVGAGEAVEGTLSGGESAIQAQTVGDDGEQAAADGDEQSSAVDGEAVQAAPVQTGAPASLNQADTVRTDQPHPHGRNPVRRYR
jgi:hypothetical protein